MPVFFVYLKKGTDDERNVIGYDLMLSLKYYQEVPYMRAFTGFAVISISYTSSNSKYVYVKSGKIYVTKAAPVGTYTIKVKAAATSSGSYKASNEVKVTVKVTKAANPMTVSPTSKTYKVSAVKAKAQTFTIKPSSAQGKVTYTSSSKKVTVTSKGKVTVKKGTAKGTYKITVKAAGNSKYKAGSKVVKVVVK